MKSFFWRDLKEDYIIGLDEVGRGSLCGPVFASACFIPKDLDISYLKLTDSKKLSPVKRKLIYEKLLELKKEGKIDFSTSHATVLEIEELNIHRASLLAMKRASLKIQKKEHLLIDGLFKIPDLKITQTNIVKGDLICEPISASSIISKVLRDRLMESFSYLWPDYGLFSNKGYASKTHFRALKKRGLKPEHRKSFCQTYLKKKCSES